MKYLFSFLLFIVLFFGELNAQIQQDSAKDVRIVVMSDLNESYGSTHYSDRLDSVLLFIEELNPDAVFNAGDVVAGQKLDLSLSDIEQMWEAFDEFVAQPLRANEIEFINSVGNHDGSGSGNFEHEREIMAEYWKDNKPSVNFVNEDKFPFYFSFLLDDIFVISLDASTHQISDEQLNWVKNQLDSESSVNASFRIVMGHLPLYSVAEGRDSWGNVLSEPEVLLEVFKQKNVDLYISGHHHAYYPAIMDSVVLLASGAIGGGPRVLLGSETPPTRTITVLDFYHDLKSYKIITYDIENNFRQIKPKDLPESIEGINGKIHRLKNEVISRN